MSEKAEAEFNPKRVLSSVPLDRPPNTFPNPLMFLVLLILSVAAVESIIEVAFLSYLPESLGMHILADSGLMIILLSPIFYHFIYFPYKKHHDFHRQAQAQIHYLSRQLINASENERKLLSQNLHDGFGQVLTTMQFGVETIRSACQTDDVDSKLCLSQSEKLSQLISDLGDYVRDVSTGLHPSMLEEFGLELSLQSHIDDFENEYVGINIDLSFQTDNKVPSEIKLAIFRVCQESLNNIVKYANAKNVVLSLVQKGDLLVFNIKDDGKGFDLNEKMERCP